MIIYPNLSLNPINKRMTIISNNASVFPNKYICTIKQIIGHIILNTIRSIIRIRTSYAAGFRNRFPEIIQNLNNFPQRLPFHTIIKGQQLLPPILKLLSTHSQFTRQTCSHVVTICIECVQDTDDFLLNRQRRDWNTNICDHIAHTLWIIASSYMLSQFNR